MKPFSLFITALFVVLPPCLCSAQQTSTLAFAGSGYVVPPAAINAAPGQVLQVSVYGMRKLFPQPVLLSGLVADNKLPTTLNGVSVLFKRAGSSTQIPVPLFAIQQTNCTGSSVSPCSPITSITLQVPYELALPPVGGGFALPVASLVVTEDGVPTGEIAIKPMYDNVHVMNTCDQLITPSYGPAAGVSGCQPIVVHANAQLVTSTNPAQIGEELVIALYGLGETSPPAVSGQCCRSPQINLNTLQAFDLVFDFRPNVLGARKRPSSLVGTPVFSGLPVISIGGYQINFIVPSPPAGITISACDGQTVSSNLTVTVAGLNSYDAASICVQSR